VSQAWRLRSLTALALLCGGVTRLSAQAQRDEQFYYPGSFNWSFLRNYREAARLFNAFDYGHAVLYQRLWTQPDASPEGLETTEFEYITGNLLRRPPRLAVAEEAVAPDYSRLAWRAKLAFDWAHMLHRQIYDAYADERLSPEARDSLIERLTDYYLSKERTAFVAVPKSMALMDSQDYSGAFRRRNPKFNGLIWAYHWLQVGLYEALITAETPSARKAAIDAAVARFWSMLEDPPARLPSVMPMTSAVAPEFSRRHPRAALIFDNLHMLHDIISDILVSPVVPRARKQAEIYAALRRFQDPTADVLPMEHWWMMGEMMGLDKMGGPAVGPFPPPAAQPSSEPHNHPRP
jgi:hypothetical protein